MKLRAPIAALAAAIGSLVAAAPAWAQDAASSAASTAAAAPAGTDNGGLIYVWVAILVVGVPVIVLGAAAGMGGRSR